MTDRSPSDVLNEWEKDYAPHHHPDGVDFLLASALRATLALNAVLQEDRAALLPILARLRSETMQEALDKIALIYQERDALAGENERRRLALLKYQADISHFRTARDQLHAELETARVVVEATEALMDGAVDESAARMTLDVKLARDVLGALAAHSRATTEGKPPADDHVCALNQSMDGECFVCGSVKKETAPDPSEPGA